MALAFAREEKNSRRYWKEDHCQHHICSWSVRGLKWRFNLPSASQHGGIWKRLVFASRWVLHSEKSSHAACSCFASANYTERWFFVWYSDMSSNHFALGEKFTNFPTLVVSNNIGHCKRYARVLFYGNSVLFLWSKE